MWNTICIILLNCDILSQFRICLKIISSIFMYTVLIYYHHQRCSRTYFMNQTSEFQDHLYMSLYTYIYRYPNNNFNGHIFHITVSLWRESAVYPVTCATINVMFCNAVQFWIVHKLRLECGLWHAVVLNATTLQWRHNDYGSVSNHQPHGCLPNRLFRCRSQKTSKLRVTGLCVGNSPGTGEFSTQMASYAQNVSIWWRHHDGWFWKLSE